MDNYYVIGTIVSTHALKGEVKVISTTDFKDERYKIGNTLFIKKDNQMISVKVKSYRVHKNYDLVSFEGYPTINDVTPFLKCKIYVDDQDIPNLEDDEFYYRDLYDCEVFYNGKLIGTVMDVVNYGASDLLVVKNQKKKEIMIPFVDEFIIDVDVKNKKIEIDVIEGLLNED